jgi:hypothetical protein
MSQIFKHEKKLYWKNFNASYNWIIHFMVAYFLILILILLWHFFESTFSIFSGTNIISSFQKSKMSQFFY